MKSLIFSTPMVKALLAGTKTQTRRPLKPQPVGKFLKPPFKPGDLLWVRETWASCTSDGKTCYLYKAWPQFDTCEPGDIDWNWRPSIHMPREAARIFLKVTDVRAERLQDIDNGDAESEGCFGIPCSCNGGCGDCLDTCWVESPVKQFWNLWDLIYAKKPEYQWDANPWVWNIAFERTEATK